MNLWAVQIQRKSHSKEVLSAKLVDVDTMKVSYVSNYQLFQSIVSGTLTVNNITIINNHLELCNYDTKLKESKINMYMSRNRQGDILIESFVIVLAGYKAVYDFIVDNPNNNKSALRIYGTVNDLDTYLYNKGIDWLNFGVFNGIVVKDIYAGIKGRNKIIGHPDSGEEIDFYSEYFESIANIRTKLDCNSCIMLHKNGMLTLTDIKFSKDDVEIPEGIQYFGISNGGACSIIFPKSLCKLNQKSFMNDEDILQLTFRQSLEEIPALLFKDSQLQIIGQEGNIIFKTIGKGAFADCYYLRDTVNINVENVGSAAFYGSYIKGFISNTCRNIGDKAFKNCEQLRELHIPSIKEIGNKAFENCCRLTNIDIKNASIIGENAFSGCKRLKTVILNSNAKVDKSAFPKNTKVIYDDSGL